MVSLLFEIENIWIIERFEIYRLYSLKFDRFSDYYYSLYIIASLIIIDLKKIVVKECLFIYLNVPDPKFVKIITPSNFILLVLGFVIYIQIT